MRIQPNVVVSPTQLETTKSRSEDTASPAKSGDVVHISAAASSATTAQATNSERLNRVRALLDAGQYAVDLDKLAARIVEDEIARSGKS